MILPECTSSPDADYLFSFQSLRIFVGYGLSLTGSSLCYSFHFYDIEVQIEIGDECNCLIMNGH